jgi:PAS domain S-box-containing protein
MPGAIEGWHIDDVPVGLMLVTDQGQILQANRALCDMLGHELDALQARRIDQVLTPAARLLYHSYLLPLLKLHGELAELSLSVLTAAGQRLDVLIKARCLPGEPADGGADGRIQFVFFPWRERRRLEEQLLSAKRAAEQVPGLLFEMRRSAAGHWSLPYASDQLRQMHGLPPMSVVDDAAPWWRSLHPDDRTDVAEALAESARQLSPWRGEYRVLLPDGEAWRETHASPHAQPDGSVLWHGYTADVTERKRLQAQVAEREAAERLHRARHEFLARVSHELRTPLNGILGFAQLLLAPGVGVQAPVHRDRVHRIEQAGRTLLKLVDEVLDVTRMQAGGLRLSLAPVEASALVDEAVQWLAPLAQTCGVSVVVQSPSPEPVWCLADRHRLLQCLTNLLSNAIKYGAGGGQVEVCWRAEGGQLCLDVLDRGPGFTAEQLGLLFEPFNRLGAERTGIEGVGLGLAITRGLVEMMSGQLKAANRPGGGACFRLSMPLTCAAGLADAADSAHAVVPGLPAVSAPDTAEARAVVLYVEDNDVNALVMESVLELRPDCALVRVGTGQEALQWLKGHVPSLLLLDMHLPDTDGMALLQQIRLLPGLVQVPAIGVSADALQDTMDRATSQGFQGYWTKPLDLNEVLPDLDAWLQRVRTQGSNVAG